MKRLVLLLCVLLTVAVTAQSDAPAPFTEIEALRIQNANLEGELLKRQIADWQAKVQALKADIEKARAGFEWNPETGALTKKK